MGSLTDKRSNHIFSVTGEHEQNYLYHFYVESGSEITPFNKIDKPLVVETL